jgi:N-methylhydantoinase B
MAYTPHDVDEIANVMIHSHGVGSPSALGLAGGYPAATNKLSIRRKTNLDDLFRRGLIPGHVSELEQESIETPPPFTYTKLKRGDVFECVGGGGGGFGDPLNRAPESVLIDVQNGLVSSEQARVSYGVALDAAGTTFDADATATERARIRSLRKATAKVTKVHPAGIATRLLRCRCGHDAHPASAKDHSIPVCENAYRVDAFTLDQAVHQSRYVVREVFCPACWTTVDTQVLIPQVEP